MAGSEFVDCTFDPARLVGNYKRYNRHDMLKKFKKKLTDLPKEEKDRWNSVYEALRDAPPLPTDGTPDAKSKELFAEPKTSIQLRNKGGTLEVPFPLYIR